MELIMREDDPVIIKEKAKNPGDLQLLHENSKAMLELNLITQERFDAIQEAIRLAKEEIKDKF